MLLASSASSIVGNGIFFTITECPLTEVATAFGLMAFSVKILVMALETLPDCDAVFFCNDDLAHGAIYYCQRHNIRVPQDVAIAGFNDLPASAWMVPSLTTIDTPRYRIGYEAASLLLDVIGGKEPRDRRIDLGFTLRERESI